MLFNSLPFLIFFPVVTILYFLLPYQRRILMMLTASCFFYMFFKPVYILILFFTIIIDYYAGILIENASGPRRKFYLSWSIVANLAVLAIFKYYNFINGNIEGLLNNFGVDNPIPYLQILLPIGLSFHTFQAMSYTIEVYRGNQKAERKFITYALYVMYYPQLVAGPIERPQNMLPQFYEKHNFDYDRTISGLKQMLWGFFKKMVVADRLAMFADVVFNDPNHYHGMPVIWAVLFFTFQIYCDFSGYSDIALGASRIMGIELMMNFNLPYISTTIKEFWTRWHISLSTWFRDYFYISIGGNRVSKPRWYFNLLAVFLVSGLWHGANWTFVIWGGLHGTYQVFGHLTAGIQQKIKDRLKPISFLITGAEWVFTMALVMLAWIFFRANNVHDAFTIIKEIPHIERGVLFGIPMFSTFFNLSCLVAIAVMFGVEYIFYKQWQLKLLPLGKRSMATDVFYCALLILCIYVFGIFEEQSFIYFQF